MGLTSSSTRSNRNTSNSNNRKTKNIGSSSKSSHSHSTMQNSSVRNSTSNGSGQEPPPPRHGNKNRSLPVTISRSLFVVVLGLVGAGLGVAAFFVLQKSETSQATVRLEGIADRALTTSREIVQRKRLGVAAMADTVAWAQPNVTNWPFVVVDGYEVLANNIIAASKARTLGLCPFVTPDQRVDFEDFAYDFLHHTRNPAPFPNTTAVSPFGKGLWQKNQTGAKVPVQADGSNTWESPHRLYAPILQHSTGNKAPVLLLNVNFEPTRGVMVDDMIECSQERNETNPELRCGVLTDMLNLASEKQNSGPDAIMMEPIFPPYSNDSTLVGFIVSSIVWRESLEGVFPEDVSGIDCVLSTPNQVFTFEIQDGVAYVKGQGDLHNHRYDEYRTSIEIVADGDFYGGVVYTLEVYPTSQFFDEYSTNNPVIGLVGAICILLVISLLFYLYDSFVRQEIDATQELLEAKRRFVRFVSHEVRTPLNTVCMGLTVLQEDIRQRSGRPMLPPHCTGTQRLVAQQQQALELDLPETIRLKQSDATEWLNLSEEVLGNTQAAVNVLNDLLNYDKIQRGKLSLELTVIPIWVLVEKTLKEFNLMAAEKEISLHMVFADNLLAFPHTGDSGSAASLRRDILQRVVVGDVSRISMMLRNLLSNGLKFTPAKGSLTVRVMVVPELDTPSKPRTLSMNLRKSHTSNAPEIEKTFQLANGDSTTLPLKEYIDIRVIDTGVGMTEDQLQTVFHDGVQFGANKLQGGGGSGLGMFIAKSIVEQHEGSLGASSKGIGHGSVFTAKLPLYYDPSSTSTNGSSTEGETAPSTNAAMPNSMHNPDPSESPTIGTENTSQRILVVDDAAPNRKLLVRLLENRGHTCDSAEHGLEAVEYVKQSHKDKTPYDTIILDFEMPVMNGPTACREMRLMGCSSFITGVTGNLLPEDVAHFKRCGANAVLPKPFRMGSLEQLWVEYGVTPGTRSSNCKDKDDGKNGDQHPPVSISMDVEPLSEPPFVCEQA